MIDRRFAQIRYTTARSLDTEKVGHGVLFFSSTQYRINLFRGIAALDVLIHIHIYLYCPKHDVYPYSPPKTNASAGPESLVDGEPTQHPHQR